MKTTKRMMTTLAMTVISLMLSAQYNYSANKKIAVLSIDSRDLVQTPQVLAKLAQMKLQAIPNYSVMRTYDAEEAFKNGKIDISTCYSVKCLSDAGKVLGVDQMLSGSAERIGEQIVVNLIIVDVAKESIIASSVREFYNLGAQMEGMIEICVNDLFKIENDPMLLNALLRKDDVIEEQVVERLNLTGPRMGAAYTGGASGQRLEAPKTEGGYNVFPVMSQFGYQFEVQYMSAGNIQALVEFIPMITGMDQCRFVPSFTFLNGFRHTRSGIEFAFGPTFRVINMAKGYYDENTHWNLGDDPSGKYTVIDNLDFRGEPKLAYAFTIAAGKTFRSGHLNIPVNAYISTAQSGYTVGTNFGFNVRRKNRR